MERVETRPHAHSVMPRNRKRPPNQSAQNSLPNGERNDVAFARKEPGHRDSADKGERNQHGIRPMKRGKNCACQQRGARRAIRCSQEPVCQIGIQPHLLEQAKGHIPQKMFGNEEMVHGAMQCAEKDYRKAKPREAGSEKDGGPYCGRPQVVGPPSNGFRSVPVEHDTDDHPNGENQPCKEVRSLESPDVPADKSAECERLEKI